MNIVILDDYQDAVRKLGCSSKLDPYHAKVYTNTVKGLGQLSVRLKDADIIVLIRERTHLSRQLIEKLPKLKLRQAEPQATQMLSSLIPCWAGLPKSQRARRHLLLYEGALFRTFGRVPWTNL